jgi:hypothetical protein
VGEEGGGRREGDFFVLAYARELLQLSKSLVINCRKWVVLNEPHDCGGAYLCKRLLEGGLVRRVRQPIDTGAAISEGRAVDRVACTYLAGCVCLRLIIRVLPPEAKADRCEGFGASAREIRSF